jgi:hypothetical protein
MDLPPIGKVGDTLIQHRHRASCHCGGVVLELDLTDGVVDARQGVDPNLLEGVPVKNGVDHPADRKPCASKSTT